MPPIKLWNLNFIKYVFAFEFAEMGNAMLSFAILSGNLTQIYFPIGLLVLITVLQGLQASSFETVLYEIIPMEELIKANQVTWILQI